MNARVHNLLVWEKKIELPVIVKVPLAIACPVNRCKLLCQVFDESGSVSCPSLPVLLLLNDASANIPEGGNGRLANSSIGLSAAGIYD